MKAFVGHSFDTKDEDLVNKIMNFLSNKVGIHCEDAEKVESKDISDKIKEKIDRNEIFVGIFTIDQEIKQPVLMQEACPKSFVQKFKNWINPKNSQAVLPQLFTTSNWVIQESGYAIGRKDKEIIFLVEKLIEKSIYNFPELQGDREIIFFDRTSLDAPLLKLYEIVDSIKSKTKTIEPTISSEIPKKEESKEEPREDSRNKDDSQSLPFQEMFDAQKKGNIEDAEEIYRKKIRSNLKDKEHINFWDANLYRWKYKSGDANALASLIKLAEETNDYSVYRQLAFCYEFAGIDDSAREQFLKCITLTANISDQVDCYVRISKSYAREKDYDSAINTLLDVINDSDFRTQLEEVFISLVEIADTKEDDYLYISFAEKALAINPINTTLHFNLGLKYSKNKKNDLAIYHYKKILTIMQDSGTLNNIAVAYGRVEMKGKEALYFEKAIENKDDTLPFANIAQKYLDEGFISITERLLKEAYELGGKGIEVHERIGTVKSRLDKILEDEEKKDKELLDSAEKMYKFRIRHADAYSLKSTKITLSELSGKWTTEKWGELDFKFNIAAKTFEVDTQERIENKTLGFLGRIAFSALGGSQPLPKEYKIRKIQIKGSINNLAGNYSIRVTEEKETTPPTGLGQTLLTMPSPDEIYSANGILIIKDNATIDILEEDSKNNRLFSHWNKKVG